MHACETVIKRTHITINKNSIQGQKSMGSLVPCNGIL